MLMIVFFYYYYFDSGLVLGLDDKIGNFEVGKDFDALVIDSDAPDAPFDRFNADDSKV